MNHCQTADIPLPNPRFLAIHAAIGLVLHLSGVGEQMDRVIQRFSSVDLDGNKGVGRQLDARDERDLGSADLPLRMAVMNVVDDWMNVHT